MSLRATGILILTGLDLIDSLIGIRLAMKLVKFSARGPGDACTFGIVALGLRVRSGVWCRALDAIAITARFASHFDAGLMVTTVGIVG